ncbi:MAG: YebC/PmpR family DNA-binding transcriptional regulator [Oscillospiraceae bacterium]|nr:YebC/PmpR family DNA-binding transcriptional regulator [Oscillospiraceae bacterium]
MSGHSKWSNIKRKKEKTDAAKAKIFTKMGREIAVIVKNGGANPAENSKLKDAIAKAKAANVPNENIERIIKKAAGDGDATNYEELIYEGYGPAGIAVVVEALTDNRNRTAGEMRHYFDKCGGNMGQSGSVMFMFDRKGVIEIEAEGLSEDDVMEAALDAGAEDFNYDGDVFEITTEPNDLGAVRDALEEKGYSFLSAEVQYIPQTTSTIDDPELVTKMEKLIDMMEENDDVQAIWHNWEMPDIDDEE